MREPEQIARAAIDDLLRAAGWQVCGVTGANIHGASGVAIREFPLPGYGLADYLLYVDGKAAGVIEAKKQGVTLSGVETQSAKYTAGLPESLPAWSRPQTSGGYTLKDLARRLVDALNPDNVTPSPLAGEGGGEGVAAQARFEAVKPLCDPRLRELILALKQQNEQIIDTVTQDAVLEAGFSEAARERAKQLVTSFEQFIQQHKDEITALQVLYNRPTKAPLKFEDLKALADTLQAPPNLWTESQLWQAYAALDQAKVTGKSTKRILTDLVSLVRYAMHQENELVPYSERVMANFKAWMAQQEASSPPPRAAKGQGGGGRFTDEQRWWLEKMAEHIASNLGIEAEDFGYAPFDQRGGLGKVHQIFGSELPTVLSSLNDTLAA